MVTQAVSPSVGSLTIDFENNMLAEGEKK